MPQQKQLDSLLNLLNRHSAEDSTRLRLLNEVGYAYCFIDADKGLEITDKAIALAKKLNVPSKLGDAYHVRGICYYTKGEFQRGLDLQKAALEIFEKVNDKPGRVKALNRMSGDYIWLSDYTQAVNRLQQALSLAREIDDTYGIATALGYMGNVNSYLGRLDIALKYFNESLKINEQIGQKGRVAVMLNNLGTIYLKTGDYKKAIEFNERALEVNVEMGIKKGIANNYMDIGRAYSGSKNYAAALKYLHLALDLYQQLGAKNNMAYTLRAIADIFATAPDSALKAAGVGTSDRYDKALDYQKRVLALVQETKHLDNLSKAWKHLSEIYEIRNEYSSALDAYKQYSTLRDSIASDKIQQEVTRKEVGVEYEKKEAVLNATHTAELKQQQTVKYALIGGAALLALGGAFSFFFYKRKRDAKARQQEAELKAEISDTEMKALRAQMNPHFIFNSLNSISDYIAKHDTKVADEYLSKFAKLMRLILENSEKKEVPLADDLTALELYMQLESRRMNNKFTYEIKVDDSIDKETTLVPPLILQPFVENSIWHGIAKKAGQGNIFIYIKKEGDMINCIVEDNGIGRNAAAGAAGLKDNTGRRSLGMKITKERIDIINRLKKTNALMKLTDLAQGTRVEVRLPLELSF